MVLQSIKMALKAITVNKTRSFLTMLGIIIGVFSLVVLVSLVNGATSFITDSVSSFGQDYAEVDIGDDKGKPITNEDLKEISEIEGVKEVGVEDNYYPVSIVANGVEEEGTLTGFSSSGFRIEGKKVAIGRGFSSVDEENHVKVAVLPYETAKKFFGTPNAVGQTVKVNGEEYDVIGILEKVEGTFEGFVYENEYSVDIPMSSFTRQFPFKGYEVIVMSFEPGYDSEKAKNAVSDYFYKRFNKDPDAYAIVTQDQINTVLDGITTALAILLGGIAAISLLVGGIGIMNIMLVSVTERTKEIGIRKAIGANTKSILLQFLIEAFVISLTGCFIGLLFSYFIIYLVNLAVSMFDLELHFNVPFSVVLLSSGFSLLVGLIFGLYPANKAAKKKPIEALRYDG